MKTTTHFLTALALIISVKSIAQNKFQTTGNAGVGTATPSVPFEIANTLTVGASVFKFGNPQQNNQVIFRDRSNSTFMFGLETGQIKIGFSGSDHKIMSTQYNAQNVELWPTVAVNSPSNILINAGANVGIGKTNPAYKLDVNGPVNASQYYINGSPVTGFTNLWLASPSNTNNIYYSGNVGLGTNNPTVPFQIATTLAQGAPVFNFGNPQQYNQIIFRDRSNATFMYGVETGQIKMGFTGSDHKIMSTQYNAQNIELWPTVALNSPSNILINAGQNVGIGTTSPQYKLHVNGVVNATQYLVNGSPMATLSGTGNALYLPTTASLGIGTASPQYPLDVAGDARIQNNLIVGGGIVITDNLHASETVTASSVRADTLHLNSGGSVRGDINASDKLNVAGNATFNNNLKVANLAGGGDNIVYADANGNLKIATTVPGGNVEAQCIPAAKPWYVGGNSTNGHSSVGTCSPFDFILQSNSVKRAWFKTDGTVSFGADLPSNSGGPEYHFHNGITRLSGNNSFGGPGIIFDGGVSPLGDWGIEYNATGLANPGLNFWKPYASTYSNNNILFLGDNGAIGMGTDKPISRLTMDAWNGDGLRVISGVNFTKALSLNNKNGNVVTENFRVNGDGTTYIGDNVSSVNGALLVVGQPNKTLKALSLVDNGNLNNIKDFFNVYGDGYTEIKVYNPTNMPANRVFAIKDLSGQTAKDIFVVKANGKTYAREVEISLAVTFPDYVFSNEYKLKSINEVADFIEKNKHLPGFEKGEYYEKNGINVNDMFVKQQEKMEEMMLYIIELEKRLKEIEKK